MAKGTHQQATQPCWWPEGKKLVFTRERATAEFWDRQWQTEDWKKQITRTRKNRYWHRILRKYLPDKHSRIVEGGRGTGHLVDAMQYWGYHAIGVDFARETIARINEVMPDLDIRYGDLRQLDIEDEYFDGYLSLGVIEHFWEGYDNILNEMKRILKPGGFAFVSFPCISRLDRLKIFFSGYQEFNAAEMPDNFYHFGLDIKKVKEDFERVGFQCVRIYRQYGLSGVQRVIPGFKPASTRLWELSKKSKVVKCFTVGFSILLQWLCGLSAMLVLRKQ